MTTTPIPPLQSIAITALPALGAELDGGIFAGLTTSKSGMHHAVILLPEQGTSLTWKQAVTWAEKLGAELPSRPVAAMDWAERVGGYLPTRQEQALLYANCKPHLQPVFHWSSETHKEDASYAWGCDFLNGIQYNFHKSYEGSVVAVRRV